MSKGNPRVSVRLTDTEITQMQADAEAAAAPAVGDASAVDPSLSDVVRAATTTFSRLPAGQRVKAIREAVRTR